MYRLTLFGPFSLTNVDGGAVTITSQKAKALLAYLAQTPGKPRSREEILALLWSDREEPQGRASLRQVLAGLRKEVGEDLLIIERNSVALNAACVTIEPPTNDAFLAGLHLADPAFEEWLRDKRLAFYTPAEAIEDDTQYGPEDGPDSLRIAILPFANLSNDQDQQYFAEGLTDDIITELARFPTLRVIGRTSSFAIGASDPDPIEAGAQLGARFLVRGSVRRSGSRLRVSVHLVDVKSGEQIWADRYDRDLEDVFEVQDEIVEAVVAKLGVSLNEIETARAKTRPTQNLRAYDFLLRARSFWWHGKEAEAYALAQRSVDEDPNHALTHAYFALQNAYQFYAGSLGLSHDTIADRCRTHAERALELEDTNPLVHAYTSMAFGFSPLLAKERGFKHSLISFTQNPNDCEVMLLHAWHLSFAGKQTDAIALLRRASLLNPLGGYMFAECYADTYYMTGDYQKALQSYNDQAEAPPQTQVVLAACLAQLGRIDEARACLSDPVFGSPDAFDILSFAKAQVATCLQASDRDHWAEGFRRAGIDI
ncbi:MAG: hypothetical protein AAF700_14545 [Pseudomonadota bacterium]